MPLHSFVAKALPFHLPRSQCVFDIWYFMRLNIYCQRCEYTKSFEYGCIGTTFLQSFFCWSVEWQAWSIIAPKAKSCSKLNKIYGFDFQVGFRGIFKQKRTEAAHSVSVRFLLCRSSYFLCCSIQRRTTNFVLNYIELTLFMLDERCVSFNMVVTQMLTMIVKSYLLWSITYIVTASQILSNCHPSRLAQRIFSV